ncbi:unnamed protein product [Phytomonas sp. Hart1]|nr:unnamed protein product [Phytomonas sp. Hart1]|eukprot:CCW67600.1 unnamed protein product [Phytomonas sp. isolate Hart1]
MHHLGEITLPHDICHPPIINTQISQPLCDTVTGDCTTDAHSESNKSPSRQEEIAVCRAVLPPGRSGRHATFTIPSQGCRHVDDAAAVSDDSEDEFVYMLQNAKSTTQAIEMIRRIQRTRHFTEIASSSRACNSYSMDSNEKIKRSAYPASQCSRFGESLKRKDRKAVELPETILDFQTAPAYTVSLTASRDAVFEDALSGFRSYLELEDRRMEAYHSYRLRRSAQDRGLPIRYERTFNTQNGIPCVSAVPIYSSESDKVHTLEKPTQNPLSSLYSETSRQTQKCHVTSSDFLLSTLSDDHGQKKEGTHTASKATTPLDDETQCSPLLRQQKEKLSTSCVQHHLANKKEEVACLKNDTHGDLLLGKPNEMQNEINDPQHNKLNKEMRNANDEDEQYWVDFVDQEYLRMQAPQLFQHRYPLELQIPAESRKRASALRTALYSLRSYSTHQYHGGSSHFHVNIHPGGEHIDEGGHITNPFNKVRREWIYVWEQFKRDIHREVLLIETTNYRDPKQAMTAIINYLEHCYNCGQAVYQKRKAEEEAEMLAREAQRNEKGERFFSFLLREGAAVIKETVENAQKTLSDLLSVTGADLASRRPNVVYSEDPLIRAVKIFDAAREVILASQQSFIGFPYQLLCEQLGTARLPLALDEFTQEWGVKEEEEEEGSIPFMPLPESAGLPYLNRDAERFGDANEPASEAISTTDDSPSRKSSDNASNKNAQQREMQRRDRELRRRQIREEQMKRLPLLVGEPRPTEFKAFLGHVRSRVACMKLRNTRYEEQDGKGNNEVSNSGSVVADSVANEDNLKEPWFTHNLQEGKDDSKSNLFREDIGGSVYLIPIDRDTDVQSDTVDEPNETEPKESVEQGVRIHLYFHNLRNVPVVCVTKLFRILTVPGFESSNMASNESYKDGNQISFDCSQFHEAKERKPNRNVSCNEHQNPALSSATQCKQEKGEEKSLLILIQVQFSLFTDEEAEVRWKWHHV